MTYVPFVVYGYQALGIVCANKKEYDVKNYYIGYLYITVLMIRYNLVFRRNILFKLEIRALLYW